MDNHEIALRLTLKAIDINMIRFEDFATDPDCLGDQIADQNASKAESIANFYKETLNSLQADVVE